MIAITFTWPDGAAILTRKQGFGKAVLWVCRSQRTRIKKLHQALIFILWFSIQTLPNWFIQLSLGGILRKRMSTVEPPALISTASSTMQYAQVAHSALSPASPLPIFQPRRMQNRG